ncbi:alkaline phosphatase D family protein [Maribacter confluentis]|uniref:Alkaline phosphatase D family protein n=1 Tax=Maribacter confluentis TaxID=1656093 RepID=A0ABT8RV41_9FLAO|nr:alkaline phosphatase D family protein [Maribacter confluentis]MDO1514232.1 alkaline phosphatase D family protein [Maribacter confluentis]
MKKTLSYLIAVLILSCSAPKHGVVDSAHEVDFTLAFGSCNKTELPNLLWDDIVDSKPNVWIWGGDNIYADTDDMSLLRAMYDAQQAVPGYSKLVNVTEVLGTWDDHDYGLNDGGLEYTSKDKSQQEFWNFMRVPMQSPLRTQKGVFRTKDFNMDQGSIKIIILDTRYFRTPLTPDHETKKRIKPNEYGIGTILGEGQWVWLENELLHSKADFNIIVSSIQFLSREHGFETWGNFPHEVDRLEQTIVKSKAKGVVLLSGDRHISEFSRKSLDGMEYPLIDFTSSGLTHTYRGFTGEPNPYRVGKVIFTESFGLLNFNFKAKKIDFQIVGDGGVVLEKMEQVF